MSSEGLPVNNVVSANDDLQPRDTQMAANAASSSQAADSAAISADRAWKFSNIAAENSQIATGAVDESKAAAELSAIAAEEARLAASTAAEQAQEQTQQLRSDLSRPDGAAMITLRGGISIQDWVSNDFVAKFGGMSDYTGIPLYDGNDSSRISATDNTPMIINALTKGTVRNNTLFLYFPAGHYGFKTKNILIDGSILPYKNLVIAGEGADVSILDYIMEDFDNVGNNENTGAKELLTIKNFDSVVFYNITAKCTTKTGYVNYIAPGTGGDPIYNGTIWFAHITGTKEVVCRNVISERGNYRGISINGRDLPLGQRTEVYLYDCMGRYTTGSVFWLRMCNLLSVDGGNFYRNGNLGITATGYGITCSQYVDDILVNKATFYENYRKGFDKHSGLGSFILKDCVFVDNILWDVSSDHQYVGQYHPDITDDAVLDNCAFIMNRNASFIAEAYAAIPSGKNKIRAYPNRILFQTMMLHAKCSIAS